MHSDTQSGSCSLNCEMKQTLENYCIQHSRFRSIHLKHQNSEKILKDILRLSHQIYETPKEFEIICLRVMDLFLIERGRLPF